MARPTYHIELVTFTGETITCTTKTPVIDLVSKVRNLAVRGQMASEQRVAAYQSTNTLNRNVALAEMQLVAARKDMLDHPESEQYLAAATKAEAEYNDAWKALQIVTDQMEAKEKEVNDCSIQQVQLIVNLPNTANGERRSLDQVDWNQLDILEAANAVNFFLTGKKS